MAVNSVTKKIASEIIFIDPGVADIADLIAAAKPGVAVFVLDAERDALAQIADILDDYSGVDALHIISHGDDGSIEFSSGAINGRNIDANGDALSRIGRAMSATGDILFYGCDIAGSDVGRALVDRIALLTGADVAASIDLTGAWRLGGDWTLEYRSGAIENPSPFLPGALDAFNELLVTRFTINTTTTGSQDFPDVASLPGGKLVAVWESDDQTAGGGDTDIGIRIMNADGTGTLELLIDGHASNEFWRSPTVAQTSANTFVVTWSAFGGANDRILGTVVTLSGNSLSNGAIAELGFGAGVIQQQPVAAPLTNGNVIVGWTRSLDGTSTNANFVVRTFDANLNALSGITQITSNLALFPLNPEISTNGTQVSIVAQIGGQIYGRSFDANANGTLPALAAGQTQLSATGGVLPGIGTLADGDILVTYTNGNNVVGRIFQDGFTSPGAEFQINTGPATNPSLAPQVAVLASGGYIVTWHRAGTDVGGNPSGQIDVYARVFDENNVARTNEFLVNSASPATNESLPEIFRGVSGGAVFAFVQAPSATPAARDIGGAIFSNIGPTATGTAETLATITEDVTNPAGTVLNAFLADQFDDLDNHALSGVAVRGNAATAAQGTWQFSSDGLNWTNIATTVSDTSATILDESWFVRFLPATNFNGNVPTLSVRLWDGQGAFTTGTTAVNISGAIFDENPNGGTLENPFSGNTIAISRFVNAVNDAPTIATASVALAAINEDTTNPTGQTVAAVATAAFSDAADNQVANGGSSANTLAGIAIAGNAETSQGAWQWFNGAVWVNVGTSVSLSNALLLSSTTLLRFLPVANFNGPAPQLTVHLIDNSAGAVSNTVGVNLTGLTGGTTAVSSNTFTIGETITAVNDQPTLTGLGGTVTTNEQTAVVLDADALIADIDLDPLGGGNGSYAGASLTVARQGGANAQDDFSFDTTVALFTVSSGILQSGGLTFATFTNSGGTLTIDFTGSGTAATSVLVDDVLRHIAYTNGSDTPPASVVLNYTLSDGNAGGQGTGGALTATGSTTVNITAIDDPGVAQDDSFATDEATALTAGNVFANNGFGADTDPDSTPTITAVNGVGASVGNQITLASGALLTLNANGTFVYNPNGAFDDLPASGSGAVNPTTGQDSFSYTLAGGDTATVTVTVSGLDSNGDVLVGDASANTLEGGIGADQMTGLAGNDIYRVDNIGDIADESVAGSNGVDRVFSSISFSLVTVAGVTQAKGFIEGVVLIGAADTYAYGNAAPNTLVGSTGSNLLAAGAGNDILAGRGGNDFFLFNTALNATTNVDTIIDMNEDGDDTIQLENAVFRTLSPGALRADFFCISTTGALDANDQIIYNDVTGELFYDANGNAGGGSTLFARLDTGLALTAADFVVV